MTIHHGLPPAAVRPQSAWLVMEDADLVTLVETARAIGWRFGRDLGILSYNDTPMKRVVANGVSVISTDFAEMGRQAARFLRDGTLADPVVPTRLILRHSL